MARRLRNTCEQDHFLPANQNRRHWRIVGSQIGAWRTCARDSGARRRARGHAHHHAHGHARRRARRHARHLGRARRAPWRAYAAAACGAATWGARHKRGLVCGTQAFGSTHCKKRVAGQASFVRGTSPSPSPSLSDRRASGCSRVKPRESRAERTRTRWQAVACDKSCLEHSARLAALAPRVHSAALPPRLMPRTARSSSRKTGGAA